MKKNRIYRFIFIVIYFLSLDILKFGLNGTVYDLVIFIIDSAFFAIMSMYIIGIVGYFKAKTTGESKNSKVEKHISLRTIFNTIMASKNKKAIKYLLLLILQIPVFIFLVYVGFKVNYKADIKEFKNVVTPKCSLISDDIHDLKNINQYLVTDTKTCEYEIGFIVTSDGNDTIYLKMLDFIKRGNVFKGKQRGLFDKEYTTTQMNQYKTIYKHGNNIVYAVAPYDKKNEVLEIIRRLGYTSTPSFDTIFS